MNKMKYESPNFDFQEMKLMEKVADTCWGYGYMIVDANKDGLVDRNKDDEKVFFQEGLNGCSGNSEGELLSRYKAVIAKFPDLRNQITFEDVKTNTKGGHIIPGIS